MGHNIKNFDMWRHHSQSGAVFYKVVAHKVLLYGSETWVLNLNMEKTLERFHQHVIRKLTNKLPHINKEILNRNQRVQPRSQKAEMHKIGKCIA